MSKQLRAFIAIQLSPQIRSTLMELPKQLKSSDADVKWVKPENMHLTLKFLGDTSEEKIPDILTTLNLIGQSHNCYPLELSHLGAFPKLEYPQIIWVGLNQGKEETCLLAGQIEEQLANCGFKKEKRTFGAHVTIGRVRSRGNRLSLVKAIRETSLSSSCIQEVNELILVQSTLTAAGPVYENLGKAALKSS